MEPIDRPGQLYRAQQHQFGEKDDSSCDKTNNNQDDNSKSNAEVVTLRTDTVVDRISREIRNAEVNGSIVDLVNSSADSKSKLPQKTQPCSTSSSLFASPQIRQADSNVSRPGFLTDLFCERDEFSCEKTNNNQENEKESNTEVVALLTDTVVDRKNNFCTSNEDSEASDGTEKSSYKPNSKNGNNDRTSANEQFSYSNPATPDNMKENKEKKHIQCTYGMSKVSEVLVACFRNGVMARFTYGEVNVAIFRVYHYNDNHFNNKSIHTAVTKAKRDFEDHPATKRSMINYMNSLHRLRKVCKLSAVDSYKKLCSVISGSCHAFQRYNPEQFGLGGEMARKYETTELFVKYFRTFFPAHPFFTTPSKLLAPTGK